MARQFGMPPSVLGRESPMSDRLHAMFSNPWYLVADSDTWKCLCKINVNEIAPGIFLGSQHKPCLQNYFL